MHDGSISFTQCPDISKVPKDVFLVLIQILGRHASHDVASF